jgi:fucose permease
LNAIFWGTMMIGRGIGIFASNYLTPTVYAYIDLIVCTIAVGLLCIPSILSEELVYGVTAVFGLGMSTVYSNGILMTAKVELFRAIGSTNLVLPIW